MRARLSVLSGRMTPPAGRQATGRDGHGKGRPRQGTATAGDGHGRGPAWKGLLMNDFWGPMLVSQLEFYWDTNLQPRLQGLTDAEYLWEPAEGCWSVRPRGDGTYQLDQ